MGWRVVDAQQASAHAVSKGAQEYTGGGQVLDVPAIMGFGGSLIYFVDQYYDTSPYSDEYACIATSKPECAGFYYLDHLTHNLFKGNMDIWFRFYSDLFNFGEIRFFDIGGKFTGLTSRALTSPCGRIRIPINEDRDEKDQIAADARDIHDVTDAIAKTGGAFMPGRPDTYYTLSTDRVTGHREPIDRMKRHGILIDGKGVFDGGETRLLLQIFSKTVIGTVFFEFIERKGDDGFGEGNFRALFESIEQEQINSGELKSA